VKQILFLLVLLISFSNLSAQEVDLRAMSDVQRSHYIYNLATQALKTHLPAWHRYVTGQPGTYRIYPFESDEKQILTDEEADRLNNRYGRFITDYAFKKDDYIYAVSFVRDQYAYKPILFRVIILHNGRILLFKDLIIGESKVIYNN